MYKIARYRLQFWIDFHEIQMLARVHPWVNLIVFGNSQANRTTDIGENMPQNRVFSFYSASMRFF